ncbi:MAG: DUF2905 domain-containing protein [Chloroflexi bacterium]|nr:DUF2905 domain-containing protein [Chloroflexota bacterium]
MENFQGLGRSLIIAGLAIVVLGAIVFLAGKVPYLGKLPGDIIIRRGNITIQLPIVTFLLLSLVITVIVNIILRMINRQ